MIEKFLDVTNQFPDHFPVMAANNDWRGLLKVIAHWIEAQRKRIITRFVAGSNQRFQCTYTGSDPKQAVPGQSGFHPHVLLGSHLTFTTRSRPQVQVTLNQGRTYFDNIVYWQVLKATLKDEEGKIRTTESQQEQIQEIFGDDHEGNEPPDDSYLANEMRNLRGLQRQIQDHAGPVYTQLRTDFELDYKSAEIARRDPDGARILGYNPIFNSYPRIAQECVENNITDPVNRMNYWCTVLHGQIQDALDELEDSRPATLEDYDHWFGGQPAAVNNPTLQALLNEARNEA